MAKEIIINNVPKEYQTVYLSFDLLIVSYLLSFISDHQFNIIYIIVIPLQSFVNMRYIFVT